MICGLWSVQDMLQLSDIDSRTMELVDIAVR